MQPQPVILTLRGESIGAASIEGENIADDDVIHITANYPSELQDATGADVTITKNADSWKVEGTINLPAGKTFDGGELTWTGLSAEALPSHAKVTGVALSGTAGGEGNALEFNVSGGNITAEAPQLIVDDNAIFIAVSGSLVTIKESVDDSLTIDDVFRVEDAPSEFKDSATSTDIEFKKLTDDGLWDVRGTIILKPGTTEVTEKTNLTWETLNGVKGSISGTTVNGVTLKGAMTLHSSYNYDFSVEGDSIDAGQSNLVKLNITTPSGAASLSGSHSLQNGDKIDLTANPNGADDSLKDISVSTKIELNTTGSSDYTENVTGYIMLKSGTKIDSISTVTTIKWDNLTIDPSSESWLEVTSVTLNGSVDVDSSTFNVSSVSIDTDQLPHKGDPQRVIVEFPPDGLTFTTAPGSILADEELFNMLSGYKLTLKTAFASSGFGEKGAIKEFNLDLQFGEDGKVLIDPSAKDGGHSIKLNNGFTGVMRSIIPLLTHNMSRDVAFNALDLSSVRLGHIHGVYLHGHQELNEWFVDGFQLDIPKMVQVGDYEMKLLATDVTVTGTATPSSGETLTVDLTGHVSDESAIGTVTITFNSATSATVSSSDLAVSNLELGKGTVEIDASNPDGWSLGGESIERVKLSGTYVSNGMTLTINTIELTPKVN